MRRLFAIFLFLCSIGVAQTPREDRDKLFADVRDAVFPPVPLPRDGIVTVVVRFGPSFSPESQLDIALSDSGGEAAYVKLADHLVTTIDALPPGHQDPRQIASKLKVERNSKTLDPKTARQDLESLWDALAKSPSRMKRRLTGIMLDGTYYRISVEAIHFSVVVEIQDAEAQPDVVTGDAEIVRWANRIRLSMTK